MRLANRALIAALATLVLCAVVSAQTLRSPNDPRNQSPSVGTGGPEGGPTGLFTVYDGATIRRGEFTFSVAYSNFDRDPGDVDITDIPLSFNVGLNDHIEVFFKTNGLRGIKANNSPNLSGFYLPNSQLQFGAGTLCVPPAVTLPPVRVSGSTALTGFSPLARPAGPPCNVGGQPLRQFPFVGATGPNYGLTGNNIAPPFTSVLGTPFGGSGNFGTASSFPGIGSVVGSILPGIVLSTRTIPPNLTFNTLTVPNLFTIQPTYIADAPFLNRRYGQSSFTNFVAGAKIRFTGPNSPLGVGVIPFYRWYPDKANDFSGFNQMQRGAGPGANIGDFGLIGFVDGRLSEHVNVSANLGYILNSNPKSDAMGGAILLDRPDELLAAVGFDFPINEHFQLIGEVRSTMYVAGRTPNAFNNNPVEALGGIKVYPRRWWGVGAAYRRHLNQQDQSHFDNNLPFTFVPSNGPNGFIGQFWVGHRNARIPPPPPNREPTGSVSSSSSSLSLPCQEGTSSKTCSASASLTVQLTATYSDPDNDTLLYTWSVTGGKLSGEGRMVSWDLTGVNPGTYTASVEVNDGNTHIVRGSTPVSVATCSGCEPPPPVCPVPTVSGPAEVDQGTSITFTARIDPEASVTYNWSVSAGTITSGQGTSSITVDTAGLAGQTVTATVELGGVDPSCGKTASSSTNVKPLPPVAVMFDEYGNIRFNDEKARLDNYAIQLQNQPGHTGTLVGFGSCEGEGLARAERAKGYLVNTRGIDAGRLTTVDGGCREEVWVELWVVPTGAAAPTPKNSATVSPCPACKKAAPRRGRGRRMDEE